jgi:transcription elongation factor Elf1
MDQYDYCLKFLNKYLKTENVTSNRRAKLHRNKEKIGKCPECGAETITDMDKAEIYCKDCGLVVKASIPYSGVKHINYPYGTLL